MARRPRIDIPGYHHIVNRGVNRSVVFASEEDKETFLRILCKACRIYDVVLHDYCLMDNHYHLLIENQNENLSLFMRQVNANYALYFNKRYHRSGHLWQGRYRSWLILGEEYLYQTIRYIEHNPIEAKMVENVVDYRYTLASQILRGDVIPPCAQESLLYQTYDIATLAHFLSEPLSAEEITQLETQRKQKIEIDTEHKKPKPIEKKPLKSYFDPGMDKTQRNQAIYEAYRQGHTQKSIAAYLGLSDAMISIVVKKFRI